MYKTILLTLDGTRTDRAMIDHVKPLAKLGRQPRGFVSRGGWLGRAHVWQATPSAPKSTRTRLTWKKFASEFSAEGIKADAELAYGDPATEIVKWVKDKGCDLVAMSTHGHRFFADLFFGTTASRVQHNISVPVLLLRAK